MRRLIGIPLAAGLLILAASAALAGSGTATGTDGALSVGAGRAIGILEDVLGELVEGGTIDQEQSDAIVAAIEERARELRTEMQERRDQLRGFLEDDVIDADELAQLPEDHPLRNVDETLLQNGQLTREELRELRRGFGPGHGHFGHRWGPGDRSDAADDASGVPKSTESPRAGS